MLVSLSYLHMFSFTGSTIPSFPSPCERPYRLRVIWNDLTPFDPSDALLAVDTSYLHSVAEEVEGPPKFLTLLSLRATLSDPGSPSGISP
jgi:hypothetical protein